MLVNVKNIGGEVIRDNEQYVLRDNKYLSNLVLSETRLKGGKSTNGHSHEGLDEVYIFLSGIGYMQNGGATVNVGKGDVVLVKGGDFHRVFNDCPEDELVFLAIFQRYER